MCQCGRWLLRCWLQFFLPRVISALFFAGRRTHEEASKELTTRQHRAPWIFFAAFDLHTIAKINRDETANVREVYSTTSLRKIFRLLTSPIRSFLRSFFFCRWIFLVITSIELQNIIYLLSITSLVLILGYYLAFCHYNNNNNNKTKK